MTLAPPAPAVQLPLAGPTGPLRRQAAPPAFARHETFFPRFGWLKKGYDAAAADPHVFLREDAPVRLGVGKNMARSIRYWCHAYKLLDETPVAGQRSLASTPSPFGERLLGPDGWDPYLEDPASLWLLHWKLLAAPCAATAWRFAFGVYAGAEASADDLASALAEYAAREYPTARTAPSSFQKDASLLLRMYGEVSTGDFSEEALQCPFADLGLLRPTGTPRIYAFVPGAKPGLADAVVVAACLEYAAADPSSAHTVSVARLLLDPDAPGMAFKLTESALCEAVDGITSVRPDVRLSDGGGVVHIAFDGDPRQTADALLDAHYGSPTGVATGGRR